MGDELEHFDLNMCKKWTHWDLNPGPSACGVDVIPLHHVPLRQWSIGVTLEFLNVQHSAVRLRSETSVYHNT